MGISFQFLARWNRFQYVSSKFTYFKLSSSTKIKRFSVVKSSAAKRQTSSTLFCYKHSVRMIENAKETKLFTRHHKEHSCLSALFAFSVQLSVRNCQRIKTLLFLFFFHVLNHFSKNKFTLVCSINKSKT